MSIEVRFIYEDASKIPASEWFDARSGATVVVPEALRFVQFRDPDLGDQEYTMETRLLNEMIDAMTDADGYNVNADIDPTERAMVRAISEGLRP